VDAGSAQAGGRISGGFGAPASGASGPAAQGYEPASLGPSHPLSGTVSLSMLSAAGVSKGDPCCYGSGAPAAGANSSAASMGLSLVGRSMSEQYLYGSGAPAAGAICRGQCPRRTEPRPF
jgi:hypothetical protein